MKKIIRYTVLAVALFFGAPACDYLNIVPDNTVELGNLFETRDKAYKALADCYSYLPDAERLHYSLNLAGDEWVGRLDSGVAENQGYTLGTKIMRDWNTASNPILSFWNGNRYAQDLYDGIRSCNIFLNGIADDIPNLSAGERNDWIAQVKILKAYYHFFLVQQYGPIVLVKENLEPYDTADKIQQPRSTIEECFDYILSIFDDVLYNSDGTEKTDLYDTRSDNFLGQIDRVIAKALKAKVLVLRASPLFNGNSEFYSNFKNAAGETYFPMDYDAEKWKEALDAVDIAIKAAEDHGKKLYTFTGEHKYWDDDVWNNSEIVQYCYNNRYSICQQWNEELVWGYSNLQITTLNSFSAGSQTRSVLGSNSSTGAFQWLGASMQVADRFFTKNGVPIDEDVTFPYDSRLELTTIPDDNYHNGYMQPGEQTVKLYLNREPRFYAWIAVDRSIWRTYEDKLNMMMRYGESPGGRTGTTADFYWTGIAVKKYVHPDSRAGAWQRVTNFPYPLIRMADLYLLYAECYNEYYGPGQEAYDKLNAVRARAGLLRPIEEVWSDPSVVRSVGKHRDQDGLREIIRLERMDELCFEGQQFNDIRRWKLGDKYYNTSIQGWDAPSGTTPETFYQVNTWQQRVWITPKSYLMPIPSAELNVNPKLDQNPGY